MVWLATFGPHGVSMQPTAMPSDTACLISGVIEPPSTGATSHALKRLEASASRSWFACVVASKSAPNSVTVTFAAAPAASRMPWRFAAKYEFADDAMNTPRRTLLPAAAPEALVETGLLEAAPDVFVPLLEVLPHAEAARVTVNAATA